MKRIIFLLLLCLAANIFMCGCRIYQVKFTHPIKCVSHRGEEFDAPEASAPAFKLAMQKKADIVKLDIQFTGDSIVVLSHDPTLTRMMNWNVKIKDVTLSEIKKRKFINVGGYANEKLLTLREGLEIVKDCPEFWIDFKAFSPEIFEKTIAEFDRLKISHDRLMVATFSLPAIEYALKNYPEIRRVNHISIIQQLDNTHTGSFFPEHSRAPEDIIKHLLARRDRYKLHGFNMPVYGLRKGFLTAEMIQELRKNGVWCSVYYVHNAKAAEIRGVTSADAFVTGRISEVRPYCRRDN